MLKKTDFLVQKQCLASNLSTSIILARFIDKVYCGSHLEKMAAILKLEMTSITYPGVSMQISLLGNVLKLLFYMYKNKHSRNFHAFTSIW